MSKWDGGGKGRKQPEEGGEEKRGQISSFFFEEKTVSVRVEERNGGFPVKSEEGVHVRVRGSLSALFIAQACRGKITKRRSRWPIFTLHTPNTPPLLARIPSRHRLPVCSSHSLSLRFWQVGSNLAAYPAQVPDQDCFWVKGRPCRLRPRPCLLEPGL